MLLSVLNAVDPDADVVPVVCCVVCRLVFGVGTGGVHRCCSLSFPLVDVSVWFLLLAVRGCC